MMNALGDHTMATRKAFVPFEDLQPELDEMVGGDWSELEDVPKWARCRLLAMRPGGPVARLMSAHAVCMKVRLFFAHDLRWKVGGSVPTLPRPRESSHRVYLKI